MTPTLQVIYSLLLGAALGIIITYTAVKIRSEARSRAAELRPELPQLAIDTFNRLEYPAIVVDRSLTPIYTNTAARADIQGSAPLFTTPEFLKALREVMQSGTPFLQLPEETAAAGRRDYKIQAFRLTKNFVAVLLRDMGEEQRLTAIRRDFIANVSHELKTPTAAIGLLAEAIQEAKNEPETVSHFANSMAQEAQRLGALTKDIINLSQAQTELRPEELQPVDLLELVQEQVAAHHTYAAQSQVDLLLTTPENPETAAVIMGNPAALEIAIANILANAIRYSPPQGKVGIGVTCRDGALDVTIADNGPGIAPEYQDRIFERFFRINSARTRHKDAGGTGLGLAIARHTVRAHGGDITLWSKPEMGSTFTLHFPLTAPAFTATPETQTKRLKRGRSKAPQRVSHAAMHRDLAADYVAAAQTPKQGAPRG